MPGIPTTAHTWYCSGCTFMHTTAGLELSSAQRGRSYCSGKFASASTLRALYGFVVTACQTSKLGVLQVQTLETILNSTCSKITCRRLEFTKVLCRSVGTLHATNECIDRSINGTIGKLQRETRTASSCSHCLNDSRYCSLIGIATRKCRLCTPAVQRPLHHYMFAFPLLYASKLQLP